MWDKEEKPWLLVGEFRRPYPEELDHPLDAVIVYLYLDFNFLCKAILKNDSYLSMHVNGGPYFLLPTIIIITHHPVILITTISIIFH